MSGTLSPKLKKKGEKKRFHNVASRRYRMGLLMSVTAFSGFLVEHAFAQTQSSTDVGTTTTLQSKKLPISQKSAGSAATNPPSGQAVEIHDVVITARKRTEDIQKIPAAVTHVSAGVIDRDNLNNVNDLQSTLPSFSYTASNPKQTNIGVRGIGNNGGNNDGIDPSVGVFIDGVYAGRLGEATNYFYDLDSIDLLRGPQGTLFGKNTIGGALVITSAPPSFTPGANIEASVGNYGFREFKGDVTGPVLGTEGKVAVRLSAFYTGNQGYQENIYNGSYNDQNQGEGARLQALIKPNSDLSIQIIGSVDQEEYNVPSAAYMDPYPGVTNNLATRMAANGYQLLTDPFSYKVDQNNRAYTRTSTDTLTANVNYDVGYGTITSITGFRDWHFRPTNDNDGTQLDAIPLFGTTNSVQQYSEELRWASPIGSPLETVGGIYVYYENLNANQSELLGPDYWIYANLAQGTYDGAAWGSNYHLQDNSQAAFAHTTWHATDRLALTAGFRWTNEIKTNTWTGYGLNGTPTKTVDKINGGNFVGTVNAIAKDSSPGADAGISYNITQDIMAYGTYAYGSVAKGINAPALVNTAALAAGASQVIAAENANSFEIGAKTEWLNHRLQLNGDGFYEVIDNYQTTQASLVDGSASSFLANVGSLISQGVEIQGAAIPIPGLVITGWGIYDDAYYGSYVNGQCPLENGGGVCNLTGKQVPFAPRVSFDLRAEYDHPINEDVTVYGVADYNWRSAQNLTLQLSPLGEQGAYGLLNLRLGAKIKDDKYDLSFFVNNATDQNYYVAIAANNTAKYYTGTPGIPLSLGATLKVRF